METLDAIRGSFTLGEFGADEAALAIDALERVALNDQLPELRQYALSSLPHLPYERAFEAWLRLAFTPENPFPQDVFSLAQALSSRDYAASRWNVASPSDARLAQARRALALAERLKESLARVPADQPNPAHDAIVGLAERALLWLEDPWEKGKARELIERR